MRKSTLVIVALLVVMAAALSTLMSHYLSYAEPELKAAKELTDAVRPDLAPGTKVKVRRVLGADRYAVKDPTKFGLVVEATAASDSATKDPKGVNLAKALSDRAFAVYGSDRPIEWVELRIRRGAEDLPPIAFARGPGGIVEPIPVEPPKAGVR